MPSSDLLNTYRLVELVLCSTTRAKSTFFLLTLMFNYQLDSLLQYPCIDHTGEAKECVPPIVGTHPPVSLLEKRNHHLCLPVQGHCHRCPSNAVESCQPGQPHNIQSLEELRVDLIHPWGPTAKEFSNYLSHLGPGDKQPLRGVPKRCFLYGRRAGGIEKILEVFLPPPNDVTSQDQQFPTLTIYSVGGKLFSPPELPDGLPETSRSRLKVIFHVLTELLPYGFLPRQQLKLQSASLFITRQLPPESLEPARLDRTLLQLDILLHLGCPPLSVGITTTTGRDSLAATAPFSRLNNGGPEHGPFGRPF
ncbi:uncharacterized protein [Hoplias malabaricus]|uniref:uncharacterized protein n=1 Tax=Hoplias malabaricus TaxID=27720 RepID=UPI0034617E1F